MSSIIGSWRDFPEKRVIFQVQNDITYYWITFTEEIGDLEREISYNNSHNHNAIYIYVWVVPLTSLELTRFCLKYNDDFLLFGTDYYSGCIAGSKYTGERHSGFTPNDVFSLLAELTFEEDRPTNILSLASTHYNHHYLEMPTSGTPRITIGIETQLSGRAALLQTMARQVEDSEASRVSSSHATTSSSIDAGYNASESGLEDVEDTERGDSNTFSTI
ncbi:hypothetical protein V8F33_014016 [Rhypophila sp. PSN 637]